MIDTGGGVLRCRPFSRSERPRLRRASPTRFEVPKTNFMPQRDLSILILKPLPR
jgi:hypothetical protein